MARQEDGQIGFLTSDGRQIKNLVIKNYKRITDKVMEVEIKAIVYTSKEKGRNW